MTSKPLSGALVKLTSSDGKDYDVAIEIASQSVTVKNMIDDLGGDGDAPIPLPNVSGRILEKIIDYCRFHYEHPTPQSDEKKDERRTDDIIPWDKEFCNVDQPTLFEMILAANFLDIKPLLDLCCKTVANALKACKDPEDIRKYLNIKNDFTPEEEEQQRKENEWCLEK
jgi:S-phase kinase-associated protein 1